MELGVVDPNGNVDPQMLANVSEAVKAFGKVIITKDLFDSLAPPNLARERLNNVNALNG